MSWKIALRPLGLPLFLVSLVFLPFLPVVTVAGFFIGIVQFYFFYHIFRLLFEPIFFI